MHLHPGFAIDQQPSGAVVRPALLLGPRRQLRLCQLSRQLDRVVVLADAPFDGDGAVWEGQRFVDFDGVGLFAVVGRGDVIGRALACVEVQALLVSVLSHNEFGCSLGGQGHQIGAMTVLIELRQFAGLPVQVKAECGRGQLRGVQRIVVRGVARFLLVGGVVHGHQAELLPLGGPESLTVLGFRREAEASVPDGTSSSSETSASSGATLLSMTVCGTCSTEEMPETFSFPEGTTILLSSPASTASVVTILPRSSSWGTVSRSGSVGSRSAAVSVASANSASSSPALQPVISRAETAMMPMPAVIVLR